MRSSTLLWLSCLSLIPTISPVVAIHDGLPRATIVERPKFYFPRVVKRMTYPNTTTTTTTSSTSSTELKRDTSFLTSRQTGNLDDFLSALNGGGFFPTGTSGLNPTSVADTTPSSTSTTPDTTIPDTTTPDTTTSSDTSVIPPDTTAPSETTRPSTPDVVDSSTTPSDTSSPSAALDTTIAATTVADSTVASSTDGLPPVIVLPTPTTDGPVTPTDPPTPTSELIPDLSSIIPDILGAATTVDVSSIVSDILDATTTGILVGLSTVDVPTVVPTPTDVTTSPTFTPGVVPGFTPGIVQSTTSSDTAIPVITPPATQSGDGGIVASITDLLTSIIPPVTTELSATQTDLPPPPIDTSSPPVDNTQPTPTLNTTDIPVSPTDPPPVTTNPVVIPPTDTAVPTTEPTAVGTAPVTDIPPGITSTPAVINGTESLSTTAAVGTDGSIVPTATVSIGGPIETGSSSSATSIVDSATPTNPVDSNTQWLPTAIATQSDDPSSVSSGATATNTGIPSFLPKVISPDGGMPTQGPDNTTKIQIGFLHQLNYPFVVANSVAAAQIFQYLPSGIAWGLQIPAEQVTMNVLQPYDTTKDLGFITTIATLFIPSDLVDQLALDLHTPPSKLYNNPDAPTDTLMDMINPSFPIVAGETMTGGAGDTGGHEGPGAATGGGSQTTGEAAGGAGTAFDGQSSPSGPISAKSVGIGVSAAVGGVAYVAAMFLVARRYKKRRQRHQRSSSLSSVMGDRGLSSGALMGGGLVGGDRESPIQAGRGTPGNGRESRGSGRSGGNSARTQNISAPMMAENSLGWN